MRSSSRVRARLIAGTVALAVWIARASADNGTALILDQSGAQVFYATLAAGDDADATLPSLLMTRGANDVAQQRRALIKFDTEHTIPPNAEVSSAVMTLTVKQPSAAGTR